MWGYDIIADGAIASGLRDAAEHGRTGRQVPHRLGERGFGGFGVSLADELNGVLDTLDGAVGRVLAQVDAVAEATDEAERQLRIADGDTAAGYAQAVQA